MERTKDVIMAVFCQLLEEKPLNKITVKEIVERCGINRNTFYYHYHDIPSLLQNICEEKVDWLIHNHCKLGEPIDCIRPLVTYCVQCRRAMLHIYRAIPRETFLMYLEQITSYFTCEYFNSAAVGISVPKEDLDVLIRYYRCSVMGVLLDWLDGGMDYDLLKASEHLCDLLAGSGKRAILKHVT